MKDKEETFTHPSYGMVGISRMNGNARLFGSALPRHGNFISLRISYGERSHHLSRDWYRATKRIVEIYLSSAQFADLLTGMNMGEGVPCTINWLNGPVEGPPKLDTEMEKVRNDFELDLEDLVVGLKKAKSEIGEILNKKSLNKSDRAKIKEKFDLMLMEIQSNLPFVLEQFQEASEKVVTHAKAEVEAFTTARIESAGLAAIAAESNMKQLKDKE